MYQADPLLSLDEQGRSRGAGDIAGAGAPQSPAEPAAQQAFWSQVAAGLQALAHFDCWVAARSLVDVYDRVISPLVSPGAADAASAEPLRAAVARATREDPAAPRGERGAGAPWPRTYPEVWAWLVDLNTAYKDVMRFYWDMARLDEAEEERAGEWRQASQRCFALMRVCDRLTQDKERHREVVTWRSLSVVLPAYNEAENIGETLRACVTTLCRLCPNFEIIVVDDGSDDATGVLADQAAAFDASIRAVHNRPNRGYGGALRAGFDAVRSELIFFMDSDGQFDVAEIAKLARILESGASPVAVGYRAKRSDPFMRKANAWGWKQAAHYVAGLRGIRDIDCAFKLFPAEALRRCDLVAQGASVNVEMLLKFQEMGLGITQIPVKHMPRTKGSPTGAKASVIVRAFRELIHLRRHMRDWQG